MSTEEASLSEEVYNISINQVNISVLSTACTFQEINSPGDLLTLFKSRDCYRHTVEFTVFLCLANLLILVFGLLGNCMVIYVVSCKIQTKTASSIFILNLAVADMLVILCCIPPTLVANLFTRKNFRRVIIAPITFPLNDTLFCF